MRHLESKTEDAGGISHSFWNKASGQGVAQGTVGYLGTCSEILDIFGQPLPSFPKLVARLALLVAPHVLGRAAHPLEALYFLIRR